MNARTPNCIKEFVLLRIPGYSRAVLKFSTFDAINLKVDRIHVGFRHKGAVARPAINLIGTTLEHIANWRVMNNLLHVNYSAVIMCARKRLSKNWIQRLTPVVCCVQEADALRHHKLHTLNWICGECSRIHVEGTMNRHCCDVVKD